MKTIHMLPIESLSHHPDNPRKNIGDVRELTASIRESGIMQNLTVVDNPNWKPGCDESVAEYWVVIGNRRLEAAKAAGLKELPCIISDMDHKAQVATMMAENMQRVDLTTMEQVQGVQMMMDLGMDTAEISRRTGIRKDAVERRRLLEKYDESKVSKAFERGATLQDFMDLSKLEDEKKRNDLLTMDIGTHNFRNRLNSALEDQADRKRIDKLCEKLDVFATRIERNGMVGGRQQDMHQVKQWYRPTMKDVEAYVMPDDVKEVRYYYPSSALFPQVFLYAAVDSEKDVEAQEKKIASENERLASACEIAMKKAERLSARHRQMRYDFLQSSPALKLDKDFLIEQLLIISADILHGTILKDDIKRFCELLGLKVLSPETYNARPDPAQLAQAAATRTAMTAAAALMMYLDRSNESLFGRLWEHTIGKCRPVHQKSDRLERWYRILEHMGYQTSDEERAMLDGTHGVFKEWEGK